MCVNEKKKDSDKFKEWYLENYTSDALEPAWQNGVKSISLVQSTKEIIA